MILSSLKLENFKQFRDPLVLTPPEGAVGVVGANGSGKTTLFEAILWAFFGTKAGGPRFSNDAIPWSGGSTAERSLVEVSLDVGGVSYTIERTLKSGKASAYVYDSGGTQITSGPADVSSWVQEKLLEMDRVAFDATFFARQKELAFFAGTTGVNRQREVGRLLGLEQVRDAQGILREDRKAVSAQVRLIEQSLEEVDFDAIEAAHTEHEKSRTELQRLTSEAAEKLESGSASLEKARTEYARQEKQYRQHNRISTELGQAKSSRDLTSERITELESRLRRMAENAQTIRELEPGTKGLSEVTEGISTQEEARRREERLSEAKKEMSRIQRDYFLTGREALELIEGLPADGLLSGWSGIFGENEDDLDLARAAAEHLEGTDEAHDDAVTAHEELKEIRKSYQELSKREVRLANAAAAIRDKDEEVEELDSRMRSIAGDGSLPERIEAERREQSRLRNESSRLDGLARASESEAVKMAKAWEMVASSDEHAKCPTCQRGYSHDEHAEVIESIREREAELSSHAASTRAKRRKLEADAAKHGERISSLEEARSDFQRLSEKRASVVSTRKGYAEKRDEIEEGAREIRIEIRGSKNPSADDISESEARVAAWRKLREGRPKLLAAISSGDRLSAERSGRETEIEKFSGGDPYDEKKHAELVSRRDEIQTITGRIQALKATLKDRAAVEEELTARRKSEAETAALVSKLEAGLSELGFSEDAYALSRETVSKAEEMRDGAREMHDRAREDLRGVEAKLSSIEGELSRYADQRRTADGKSVEVTSLGSMDSLFTEFYRELTARVRPQLQREASELVKTLTDGRYQQMEFDENYGVRLYDGVADSYEISRFSGGEADIVSLSARVALSKMISGKGTGALGFIVLDEVFGALDANRRSNVLFALERLKATFGQIFMISHVQDVQESQLLDETWFVEEDEDGRSSVRVVRHGGIETPDITV